MVDDETPGSGGVEVPGDDALVAARIALADVVELPLGDRADVFEHVHGTVVAELRRLEHG